VLKSGIEAAGEKRQEGPVSGRWAKNNARHVSEGPHVRSRSINPPHFPDNSEPGGHVGSVVKKGKEMRFGSAIALKNVSTLVTSAVVLKTMWPSHGVRCHPYRPPPRPWHTANGNPGRIARVTSRKARQRPQRVRGG